MNGSNKQRGQQDGGRLGFLGESGRRESQVDVIKLHGHSQAQSLGGRIHRAVLCMAGLCEEIQVTTRHRKRCTHRAKSGESQVGVGTGGSRCSLPGESSDNHP